MGEKLKLSIQDIFLVRITKTKKSVISKLKQHYYLFNQTIDYKSSISIRDPYAKIVISVLNLRLRAQITSTYNTISCVLSLQLPYSLGVAHTVR